MFQQNILDTILLLYMALLMRGRAKRRRWMNDSKDAWQLEGCNYLWCVHVNRSRLDSGHCPEGSATGGGQWWRTGKSQERRSATDAT